MELREAQGKLRKKTKMAALIGTRLASRYVSGVLFAALLPSSAAVSQIHLHPTFRSFLSPSN